MKQDKQELSEKQRKRIEQVEQRSPPKSALHRTNSAGSGARFPEGRETRRHVRSARTGKNPGHSGISSLDQVSSTSKDVTNSPLRIREHSP